MNPPLLYNLANDPFEQNPIPIDDNPIASTSAETTTTTTTTTTKTTTKTTTTTTTTTRLLAAKMKEMALVKDAEMRGEGAEAQMTFPKIVLNPTLMPFCQRWPYLWCQDDKHIETYI